MIAWDWSAIQRDDDDEKSDPQCEMVATALESLVHPATIERYLPSDRAFRKHTGISDSEWGVGCSTRTSSDEVIVWLRLFGGKVAVLRALRPLLPFTAAELSIAGYLRTALRTFVLFDRRRSERRAVRVAMRHALENYVANSVLGQGQRKGNRWTPTLLLSVLQDLSVRSYEGHPCTSGFLIVRSADALEKAASIVEFEPLATTPLVTRALFDSPSAYRQVDGSSGYYVVNQRARVIGIVRFREAGTATSAERSAGRHVRRLLDAAPGVAGAVRGDENGVVSIVTQAVELRWTGLRWHVFDEGILASALSEAHLEADVARAISDTLVCASETRLGALVLIATNANERPKAVSRIDPSGLGAQVTASTIGKRFVDLVRWGSALGVVSSDGLTTLSRDGVILGCGEIISNESSVGVVGTGGGRTQAGRSASKYGLAIKVSEDGPMTLFRDGAELVRLVR